MKSVLTFVFILIGGLTIGVPGFAQDTEVPEASSPDACQSSSFSHQACDRWYNFTEKTSPDACAAARKGHKECGRWYHAKKYVPPPPPPPVVKKEPIVLRGVHFVLDKSEIQPRSYPILDQNVRMLQEHPTLRVEIVGHTDSQGPAAYNQKLSERRAQAVMQYFITKGIAPARLSASGRGENEPVDSNETPIGRARNRRIELHR